MTREQDTTLGALQTALQMEIDGKEFYLKSSKLSTNKLGKELLKKLAAHNLSSRKIAAQMGRSTAWAHDHVTRLKRVNLAPADDLVEFAVDELGGVICEGCDWPRNREGEDLAPVMVEA